VRVFLRPAALTPPGSAAAALALALATTKERAA
jgi:hypothetical protein